MEMESSRRSIESLRDSASLKKPRLTEDPDTDRPFQPKQQPPPPLASRLRAARDDDPIRLASTFQTQQSDIIAQYKAELADLTFNSKPIITNLTIIAGENLPAAKGISATICTNILEVPSEQKLPSLYLLDSIVKNIGRDYIKYFAARLPEVFCKAYRQVAASVHPAMRHLFGTWKGVFPLSTLQSIEKELGFQPAINGSSSAAAAARPDSQAQRPAHSIHVNPKYLARQCLQRSNRAKEISSDDAGSTVTSAEDVEKPDRTSIIGSSRPWTDMPAKLPNIHRPQRDPLNEAVDRKNSGSGYADYKVSDVPRHVDLGPGNVNERIPERSGLEKSWYGAGNNAADTTLSQRNGFDFPDTYRNYRLSRSLQNTSSQLPSTQHVSSSNSRGTPENWKNSEEEEFVWDHMNSRFSDRGTNSSRKDGWDHDNEKPESLPRAKWMPSEIEHLDTRWNTFDTTRFDRSSRSEDRVPFQREAAEDHLQQPHGWEDIRSRGNRDTAVDSLLRGQPPLSLFGYQTPPQWPTQEHPLTDGLNLRNIGSTTSSQTEALPTSASSGAGLSSSLARTGIQPHSESPPAGALPSNFGSGSGMLYQRQQPLRPASPAPLSGYQRPQSPSSLAPHNQQSQISVDNDHLQTQFSRPSQTSSQLLVQLNEASHVQAAQDTKPLLPPKHLRPGSFPNLSLPSSQPPQHVQSSSALATYTQARHNMPFSQRPQSKPSLQKTQSESSLLSHKSSQPSFVGAPQTATGYSGTGTNNPIADILRQSSTGSLLAAIMNSGLVSAKNPVTSSFTSPSFTDSSTPSHFSALPPLPSGPPPIPLPSSSLPMATPTSLAGPSAHGSALGPAINAPKAVLPPLPPGPPPPPSHVGSSSQGSSATDPLSSLLSSLVAKGLISTPQKEVTTSSAPHVSRNSSVPVSSVPSSSSIQSSSFDKELLNSVSRASETSLIPTSMVGTKGLIGIEFKPEIIRQLHQLVIDSLFNDLPHQCSICGVRVRLQEELSRHIEWHDSKKRVEDGCDKVSRRWFASLSDWIAGDVGPSTGSFHVASAEGRVMLETVGPMVPADENQCICILCGELFEDFYSEDRDEWMYEGAVYMDISLGEGNLDCTDKSTTGGPIVHANCISTSSNDLELV